MALHEPACLTISRHIERERNSAAAKRLPIAEFIRLAVVEFDNEHIPEPIDPVDAYKRMRELGWTEAELRYAAGDR